MAASTPKLAVWLRSFDQCLRESIDYAICHNSLRSRENELWLHVYKSPENAYVKQIFEGLSNVAEEVGVTVRLKHKKINVSNSRVNDNTTPSSVPTLENNLTGDFSPTLLTDLDNKMKQQATVREYVALEHNHLRYMLRKRLQWSRWGRGGEAWWDDWVGVGAEQRMAAGSRMVGSGVGEEGGGRGRQVRGRRRGETVGLGS
nr:nicalin-1-like [Tanacetum cinerariifolium]